MVEMALPASTVLRTERFFYLAMSYAIAAAVLLGFARSVFLRPWFQEYAHQHAPVEPWFYVHGTFFLMWIALFAAQTTLMTAGNPMLHRRLGSFGAVLIPIMLCFGTIGALIAARRPTGFFDVAAGCLLVADVSVDLAVGQFAIVEAHHDG